jgi:hypothetical protein
MWKDQRGTRPNIGFFSFSFQTRLTIHSTVHRAPKNTPALLSLDSPPKGTKDLSSSTRSTLSTLSTLSPRSSLYLSTMPCAGNSYGNLVSFQELSQLDQHAVNLALKQYLVDGEAGRTKTVQQNSLIKALQLVLPYVPQALQEPQFAVERAVAERHPSGARRYDGCGVTNGTTCDGGEASCSRMWCAQLMMIRPHVTCHRYR